MRSPNNGIARPNDPNRDQRKSRSGPPPESAPHPYCTPSFCESTPKGRQHNTENRANLVCLESSISSLQLGSKSWHTVRDGYKNPHSHEAATHSSLPFLLSPLISLEDFRPVLLVLLLFASQRGCFVGFSNERVVAISQNHHLIDHTYRSPLVAEGSRPSPLSHHA